jgi:hypothetical protein
MGESLLVRKGGGGAKIEEIIKSYKVAAGQTISAGTFVDYINGSDLSVSSPTTIRASDVGDNISAVLLSSTANYSKVLIAYRDADGFGKAQQVIITENQTFSVEAPFTFNNASTFYISLVLVRDEVCLVAFRSGASNIGQYRLISQTAALGSVETFYSGTSNFISAVALDKNRVIIAYSDGNNSSIGKMVYLTVSNDLNSISQTQLNFTYYGTFGTTYHKLVKVDDNTIIAFFANSGDGAKAYARMVRASGSSLIASGTATVITDSQTSFIDALLLPPGNRVLFAARTGGDTNVGTVKTVGINLYTFAITNHAGITFQTAGSPARFGSINKITLALHNAIIGGTNLVMLSYADYQNSNFPTVLCLTVSGTTITILSSTVLQNTIAVKTLNLVSVIENAVFSVYANGNDHTGGTNSFGTARMLLTNRLITNPSPPWLNRVFGLAKTGGTENETIEVYMNNTKLG